MTADGGHVPPAVRPHLLGRVADPPVGVRRSWLRLIDPAHPSPLASLALDIKGAEDYLRGRSADPESVALHADDAAGDLVVDLVRPATDFVNIVAGPSFAVVPPAVGTDQAALLPGPGFVASGGYVLTGTTATGLSLTANSHYWADAGGLEDRAGRRPGWRQPGRGLENGTSTTPA
jgi:hypothetical protein